MQILRFEKALAPNRTRAKFYCFLNTVFIIVENLGGIP